MLTNIKSLKTAVHVEIYLPNDIMHHVSPRYNFDRQINPRIHTWQKYYPIITTLVV